MRKHDVLDVIAVACVGVEDLTGTIGWGCRSVLRLGTSWCDMTPTTHRR